MARGATNILQGKPIISSQSCFESRISASNFYIYICCFALFLILGKVLRPIDFLNGIYLQLEYELCPVICPIIQLHHKCLERNDINDDVAFDYAGRSGMMSVCL